MCTLVLVDFFRFADEVVERAEPKRPRRVAERLTPVDVAKLVADLFQVQETQVSRVRLLTDREIDDVVGDEVVDVIAAGLDCRLRLGVRRHPTDDDLAFLLLLIEFWVDRIVHGSAKWERCALV